MFQDQGLQRAKIILLAAILLSATSWLVFVVSQFFLILSFILIIVADFVALRNNNFSADNKQNYFRMARLQWIISGLFILVFIIYLINPFLFSRLDYMFMIILSVFVISVVITSIAKWIFLSRSTNANEKEHDNNEFQEKSYSKKTVSSRFFLILLICSMVSVLIVCFSIITFMKVEMFKQGNTDGGLGAAIVLIIGAIFWTLLIIFSIIVLLIMFRARQKHNKKQLVSMAILMFIPGLLFSPYLITNGGKLSRDLYAEREQAYSEVNTGRCYKNWIAAAPISEERRTFEYSTFIIDFPVSWRVRLPSDPMDSVNYLYQDSSLILSLAFKNPETCTPVPDNFVRNFYIFIIDSELNDIWQKYSQHHNLPDKYGEKSNISIDENNAQAWDYNNERTIVMEYNDLVYVLVFDINQKEHQNLFNSFRPIKSDN